MGGKDSSYRITFVNPPLSMEERYGKLAGAGNTMPSLGLLSLAAVGREHGFEPSVIEACSLGSGYEQTLDQIVATAPGYVGITATTVSVYSAARLAGMLKERMPGVRIVLGGAHLTATPEKTMSLFPEFDVGVLGEGEETLIKLLEADCQGDDLSQVPGLIVRNSHGLCLTGPRPYIKDLDRLPFPAWDLLPDFPKAYQPTPMRFKQLPAASLVTTRGCPNRCLFCDRSVFGNRCRSFSPEYVLEMIRVLHDRYRVRELVFEDDTMFVLKKNLTALCEMLLREGWGITWSCLGRVNSVEPELLALMKRAGCWQIGYGIESGNQQILDFIQKKIKLEQVERALRWTKEAGIHTKGFFILGHPLETRETMQETIDFAKRVDLDDISVFLLTPFPGSQLHDIASQYGQFDDDWRKMNLLQAVFVPTGLTSKELEEYLRRAMREFYLRPRIVYSYLGRVLRRPSSAVRMFQGGAAFGKAVLGAK